MSVKKLLPNNFRYRNIINLMQSVSSNNWYFFVGDHIPHANTSLQSLTDNETDSFIYPYSQMIMGKRIYRTDVVPVIRRIPWENKIFAMYDQDDKFIANSDFYCMVEEGSFYHVWKCLDNNNGANSIVEPVFAEGANTVLYETSDGYRWKYMASADTVNVTRFGSANYFPLYPNTSVSDAAVNGRIDVIKIDAHQYGKKYNNYLDGSFAASDIRIEGDSTLFNVSNNIASTVNGYYTDCIIYITAGVGQGQYQTIIDYASNTTGNIIRTEGIFPVLPMNSSYYEIRPRVNVRGNGMQTINCVARALVNSVNGNSIYRIEVLQQGAGYMNASANVLANAVVGLDRFEIAIIRPIIGPYGGHGHWIAQELYCHNLEFAVSLANNENGTLPTSNQFQQIGLIRAPLFQNVELTFAAVYGLFTSGEKVFVVTPQLLVSNCVANVGNTIISANNASFFNQVVADEYLIVSSADNAVSQLVQVNTIINATSIIVASNMAFTCASAVLYVANVGSNALISTVTNNTIITITNCPSDIGILDNIIGVQSGAFGMVNKMKRNNVVKGLDTFIQLYKYEAARISGTFIENEMVSQGTSTGYVHHVTGSSNILLYLSNMTQMFQANSTVVIGSTSGATATILTKYEPEVIPGSGLVQQLENIEPVTRANTQSENFQIFINF